MRVRFVPIGLLLLSSASLPGQTRLSPLSTDSRLKLVPIATVTIPAMAFRGDLAGIPIALGYDMVWMGGELVELRSLPGSGAEPAATTVVVSAPTAVPAGTYSVRWDFVNVGFASQMAIRSPTGATLTTCALNAWPGYTNVQSCSFMLGITDGRLHVSIKPTTFGAVMTLKQVTVARYQ